MDRYIKLEPGKNFTVAFVGGSITGGQGAMDAPAFPYWTEQILQTTMGKNVSSMTTRLHQQDFQS